MWDWNDEGEWVIPWVFIIIFVWIASYFSSFASSALPYLIIATPCVILGKIIINIRDETEHRKSVEELVRQQQEAAEREAAAKAKKRREVEELERSLEQRLRERNR